VLDRLLIPTPAAAADEWLKPHRLEYLPLDGELAVVRLVAALPSATSPGVGATLVVGGPDGVLRSDALGSLTHRIPRRFRAADELLWRVTFALPLELVQSPDAVFGLVATGCAPTRLPDVTLATLAALSEPWPVGSRGASLFNAAALRRAAALGTVIAVTSSSTAAPALAVATSGLPGQPCQVPTGQAQSPAPLTVVHGACSAAPSFKIAKPAAGKSSDSASKLGAKPASLVGHAPRADRRQPSSKPTDHASRPASHSARATSPAPSSTHSAVPTPASSAGTSGTGPGSEATAPPSAAVHVASSKAPRTGNDTQFGIDLVSGRVSRLSPVPPGSLGAAARASLAGAVGHAPQGLQSSTAGVGLGHGKSPARGAHPRGAGGGAAAAPKPEPTPAPSSGSGSESGLTPGSSPFSSPTAVNSLFSKLAGVYSQADQPPPFLIPIYKQAGARFHIPWEVLAAINSVETDFGRNVNTSSAGAIGWMQFMPSTWAQYGMAIDHSGPPNPYNPADAIFSAARYLAANGGATNVSQAVYAYNHAQWYVDEVLARAQLIREHVQGGLINPFPLGWVPNRLDMGYDGTFTGAILAPFAGTITYAARSFSNWGGYVELKADKPIPGLPSDTLYFAEGLAPSVKTGEHVGAGQLIAVPAHSPYGDAYNTTTGGAGQIEWGLASPGLVGSPTNPLVETGISHPAAVVIGFAIWVVKNLDLAPPSQVSNAGYA
jgi:Transglycosylase SLT domain